jgi:hypothetical protein
MKTHSFDPLGSKAKLLAFLITIGASSIGFGQSTWNNAAGGNWITGGNWTPTGSPSSVGAVTNFGDLAGTSRVVTLTTNHTVGTMNFTGADGYNFAAATPVTLNMNVVSGNAVWNMSMVDPSGGVSFNSNITIALQDNLQVNNLSGSTKFIVYNGTMTGTSQLIINGRLAIFGSDNRTGNTVINSGILQVGSSGGTITASPNIIINGGTLTHITNSNVIANTTAITLNGGTWSMVNVNETVASLTVSANSTIDTDSVGVSILNFTGGATYTGGTLTIIGWQGSLGGGGAEQIIFGSPVSSTFLNNIFWQAQNITGAFQLGSGEIVPVPEASNILGGIGLALAAIGYEVKRRRALKVKVEPAA